MRRSSISFPLVCMLMSSAAFAQSGGDVVMRRPLPNVNGVPSTQTGITPTPTASASPTPTVTPTPGDGFTQTPGTDPVVVPDPTTFGFYQWVVGDWQGSRQCRVETTLVRPVQCNYIYFDPKQNYKQGTAHVADSYCASQGPKAANTYKGSGAGCEYHVETLDPGPWEGGTDYAGNPIDAHCSSDAKRRLNHQCVDASDDVVPMSYCTSGIDADSTTTVPDDYEYGNFEGCGYRWRMRLSGRDTYFQGYQGTKLYGMGAGDHYYCGQEGDTSGTSGVGGPVLFVDEMAECVRSDGMGVADDQCGATPKPAEGLRARGACHHAFHLDGNYNTTQQVCLADGAQVLVRSTFAQGDAETACNAAIAGGATCCMERNPANDYDVSHTQVIATRGSEQKYGNGAYYTLYNDEGQDWRGGASSGLEYNPDSCQLTNEDGDAIGTLQAYQCK